MSIKNMSVTKQNGEVRARWRWVNDEEQPKIRLFKAFFPEERFLKNGLFLKDEICTEIEREIELKGGFDNYISANKKTSSMDVRALIHMWEDNHLIDTAGCSSNTICFVCFIDNAKVIYRDVIPLGDENEIQYTIERPSLTKKVGVLLGKILHSESKDNMIKVSLTDADSSRYKVIAFGDADIKTYAVIPRNTDCFYLNKSLEKPPFHIYYLASLIE